jgi:hypothetical protein
MDLPRPQGGEQRVTDVWLTCCAWCARIKVLETWVESGQALELISASGKCEPRLTHGICSSCYRQVSARAARERQLVNGHVESRMPERYGNASNRSNP